MGNASVGGVEITSYGVIWLAWMVFSLYCMMDLPPLNCLYGHFLSGHFLNVIFCKGQDYFPNLFIFQTINTFRRSSPLNWVKIHDLVKSALAILSWANCLTCPDSSFLFSMKQASDFWYSFLFQHFPPMTIDFLCSFPFLV